MNQLVVAALYQFVELPDYRTIRAPLLDTCISHGLRVRCCSLRRESTGPLLGPVRELMQSNNGSTTMGVLIAWNIKSH